MPAPEGKILPMTRNFMHWLMLGFALLMILASVLFAFQPAYAQAEQPIVAPSSIWFDIWQIIQPTVAVLITTVGPVIGFWISARVIALLKVTDENKKLEIEAKLREALHQSAFNALNFALAKGGVRAVAPGLVAGEAISEAIKYVQEKNPETLAKLGVDQSALKDIIVSKVPDILGPTAKVSY
jgi:Mn2+/Fe2+ NRAMP family transporter